MTINLLDTSSSKKVLSSSATENFKSKYYQVEQFGFLVLTSNEQHPQTWYPTPDVIVESGWFSLEFHGANFGDFNGDGLTDLILLPMLFPHNLPRQTRIDPIILIQDSGGFKSPLENIELSDFPNKYFLYRIGIGDFNTDGISDIAFSTMSRATTMAGFDAPESPLVVYGGKTDNFSWTDNFNNLQLAQGSPDWKLGYSAGHSMAVGDFNGDGRSDFFSQWDVFYSIPAGSFDTNLLISQWGQANVNACASSDFNEDGYDDLILSTMPDVDNGTWNGGDLWFIQGSASGLGDFSRATKIPRLNNLTKNIGTNFMVSADFNGDGHKDLFFVEHGWRDESNNPTDYYSLAKFRLFLGDGHGALTEHQELIEDPYSGFRSGEGNIYVVDMNGDGWLDIVTAGYKTGGLSWGESNQANSTGVFLNHHGTLMLEDYSNLAFVEPYQFRGEEQNKPWLSDRGASRMIPIDIGNDGMVDFVGSVDTPMHQWPQTEQIYTYTFVSKALKPLGRTVIDEELSGTVNTDKIYGFNGNDTINGGLGNDIIDGGLGTDNCIYSDLSTNYTITKTSTGYTVQANVGSDGVDTLVNIEKLQFTDQTLVIGVALLEGTTGKDKLTGTTDDDGMYGYAGNDAISGLAGNDTLDGGAGNDSMVGGLGNDTYYIDATKDVVTEKANEGTDTVVSTATYTLANNIENLTLSGYLSINAVGNLLNNSISGNSGVANSINGGLGNDTLTGGDGNDTFVFNTKLGATNVDTLTDFASGDTIALAGSIFTKLKGDKDLSDNFALESATTIKQYLIYNPTTGKLYYDADGNGKGAPIQIALIGTDIHAILTASDFTVI